MKTYSCKRCLGSWASRRENTPARCGRCKSPYWKTKRTLRRVCGGCGRRHLPKIKSSLCVGCFYFARKTAAFIVHRAVCLGVLKRLSKAKVPCRDCGARAIHYDHRDYGKPLKVDPTCQSCNFKRGTAKLTVHSYKKIRKNNLKMSIWLKDLKVIK